jgi:hypothetical protein
VVTGPSGHPEGVDIELTAADQGGVVSRIQAYDVGVSRAQVRANVRARRWRRVGSQTISLTTGPLSRSGQLWSAVFEAGPRAFLDGTAALEVAGLRHFSPRPVRVSVPRGARVRRARGLDIRQTRRWSSADVAAVGIPRSRPAVAAIRAALWARSDKQAALVLTMVVQQGIASAEALGPEMLRVRRDKRRRLLHSVLLDLLGGVRSLGELEFARECRRRGIPEPDRQVVRRSRSGRYHLDAYWDEWGLVVETWAGQVVGDALRQNDLMLTSARILRLPLLGLRVASDDFFEQIGAALEMGGWLAAA